MSETPVVQEQDSISPQGALERLAGSLPEIPELKSPEVQDAANVLVEEFGIQEGFFSGEAGMAHTLLLASIASNLVQLEAQGKTALSNPREFEYIADATMVVAMDYVTGFEQITQEAKQEARGSMSEQAYEAVLHKYKSHELTEALAAKIKNGKLLESVREKLGITDDNEDPYELLVLSVASDSFVSGFAPDSKFPDYDTLPPFSEMPEEVRDKYTRQGDIANADANAAQAWKKGLVARREQFMREGGGDFVAPAFVTTVNETTYLCLSADTAERLAYDQPELRDRSYTERFHEKDLAYLGHEYTHTQGSTSLENHVGIGVEERRAEWFSGDHHGYRDIKALFQDIRLITGFDIISSFESHPKGGATHEIYGDIAQELGLDMLAKIVTAFPRNYVHEQSSNILKSMDAHMQGYDGVTRELLERTKMDPEATEQMNARLDETIALMDKSSDFFETLLSSRKIAGSNVGTNLIAQRAGVALT